MTKTSHYVPWQTLKNAEDDPIFNAFEKILQGLDFFAFFISLKDFLRQLILWSRQETIKHSPFHANNSCVGHKRTIHSDLGFLGNNLLRNSLS